MGISPSNKYPRAFITVRFGAGGQSPLLAPKRILVTGYRAIVGPSVGAGSDNLLYPVPSVDDAIALFGGGSELYQQVVEIFDQQRDATVYGIAFPEAGGGTAAEWTLTITNASVLGGTLALRFNGILVEVVIPAATSAADQATAVYTTVSKYKNLPVYIPAAPNANTVVFRWKHKGDRGNQMLVRSSVDTITGSTYALTQTTQGATDADPTTALDAIAARDFDFIVCPSESTDTSVGTAKWVTYVNNRADPLIGLRGVVVAATRASYANAVTWNTGLNAHRLFPLWSRNAENTCGQIAARWAATIVGKTSADPTANMNFATFNSFRGPVLESDRISETEATNALNNGLPCVRFTQQDVAYVPRAITSRFQDVNGNPDYRTLDIGKVLEPDFVADYFEQDIPVSFDGYKLQDDDPNDAGQVLDKVCTPSLFKSYVAAKLRAEYAATRLKNPEQYINGTGTGGGGGGVLKVFIHPDVPQRLVVDVPLDVVNIFAQVEMTLRQVG